MTCRGFHTWSRRGLFTSIRISSGDYSIDALTRFLEEESNRNLSEIVEAVTIVLDPLTSMHDVACLVLPYMFPRLSRLRIAPSGRFPLAFRPASIYSIRGIKNLVLGQAQLTHVDFVRLLYGLPNLKSLDCSKVTTGPQHAFGSPLARQRSRKIGIVELIVSPSKDSILI